VLYIVAIGTSLRAQIYFQIVDRWPVAAAAGASLKTGFGRMLAQPLGMATVRTALRVRI
jgi:hypothetical protein